MRRVRQSMAKSGKSALLHSDFMRIDGRKVPVTVRHNPRAERIIVRVDLTAGSVQVTAPSRRGFSQALRFAHQQKDWIAERLEEVPPPVPFEHGARIPLRGRDHVVRHVGENRDRALGRGPVWRVRAADASRRYPEIRVTGHEDFVTRRVRDWLIGQARDELTERVFDYADYFGLNPARITVRDQTTRWGSCSPSRALSFSWRLIMAPPYVLDYVAAHEVVHLRHMNHGPRFWSMLEEVIPNMRPAKRWLERQGPSLHRYGAETGARR